MTKTGIELTTLNPPQREAVEHGEGPLLVLAGAGSGKTRVITYRIAHLIASYQLEPDRIMAVTFTNKAAQEMRERINKLMGKKNGQSIWIGTFHALCLRILKQELSYDFSIYDQEESKRLIKECQRELNIDEKMLKADVLGYRIESAKHELIDEDEYDRLATDFTTRLTAKVYKRYQAKLEKNRAFDFGDLIMSTVKLFKQQPELLERYRLKFRFILVDEYQDINHCQYYWIRQLAGEQGNLTVVGDDDQSIYQFRGADVRNILEFERDYPNTKVIKLEQNYRSSQIILTAAGAVVKNNKGRKEKSLWTDQGAGTPLVYFRGQTESEEAGYVIKTIVQEVFDYHKRKLSDCVILYRTNAQSRPFEDALRRERIPYKIVGGMKFYDRMEIKDILSYLKLLSNPNDELALARVINTPARGLGEGALSKVRQFAFENNQTTLDAINLIAQGEGQLPDRARQAVTQFSTLINKLKETKDQVPLPQLMTAVIAETGYLAMWEKAPLDEGQPRIENLNELIVAADEFSKSSDGTLKGFLDQIALVSNLDEDKKDGEQVTLMTFHSAKGLEFPLVLWQAWKKDYFRIPMPCRKNRGLLKNDDCVMSV
jgi:DNA helicase-2/ATP-dependent DNA helicase PcrA